MAKIKINFYIDVEVTEENGHSWEALREGYDIVKSILSKDERIDGIYYEGISEVYKEV